MEWKKIVSGTGAAEAGVSKKESKATEPTYPSESPAFGQLWGKKSVAATTPSHQVLNCKAKGWCSDKCVQLVSQRH